jgi:hypothetical protein
LKGIEMKRFLVICVVLFLVFGFGHTERVYAADPNQEKVELTWRFDKMEARVGALENRVAVLEGKVLPKTGTVGAVNCPCTDPTCTCPNHKLMGSVPMTQTVVTGYTKVCDANGCRFIPTTTEVPIISSSIESMQFTDSAGSGSIRVGPLRRWWQNRHSKGASGGGCSSCGG